MPSTTNRNRRTRQTQEAPEAPASTVTTDEAPEAPQEAPEAPRAARAVDTERGALSVVTTRNLAAARTVGQGEQGLAVARAPMSPNATTSERWGAMRAALLAAGITADYTPSEDALRCGEAYNDWTAERIGHLTHRAYGATIREAGEAMGITLGTAKSHSGNVLKGMGGRSIVEAVVEAVRVGLLPVPTYLTDDAS